MKPREIDRQSRSGEVQKRRVLGPSIGRARGATDPPDVRRGEFVTWKQQRLEFQDVPSNFEAMEDNYSQEIMDQSDVHFDSSDYYYYYCYDDVVDVDDDDDIENKHDHSLNLQNEDRNMENISTGNTREMGSRVASVRKAHPCPEGWKGPRCEPPAASSEGAPQTCAGCSTGNRAGGPSAARATG